MLKYYNLPWKGKFLHEVLCILAIHQEMLGMSIDVLPPCLESFEELDILGMRVLPLKMGSEACTYKYIIMSNIIAYTRVPNCISANCSTS